jgi:hypothetical protein
MKITLEHKPVKIAIFIINGLAILLIIIFSVSEGFGIKTLLFFLILSVFDIFIYNELKKFRSISYADQKLISYNLNKSKEVINFDSVKEIVRTGGRIGSYNIYRIEYINSENVDDYFLIAPLRNNKFENFIKDLKSINKKVRVKRTYP